MIRAERAMSSSHDTLRRTVNPALEESHLEDYRICTRCVMDTVADPDIRFDENGICNYDSEYDRKAKVRLLPPLDAQRALADMVATIKEAGRDREYDCIVGVSGGVDSTYAILQVKELGLRPLAVHFDNGWDSELATSNIEKVLNDLQIDLNTYVVEWEEFRDLQLSFLKASTPDGEIPTDHAYLTLLYKIAAQKNIKHIITGNNFRTEGILPRSWAYGYLDWRYIKNVHETLGKMELKTFPHLPLLSLAYYTLVKRIRLIAILNYQQYDRNEVVELLKKRFSWRDYGGKHYESIYTKFFQGYVLPRKFRIDKRRIHLSTLIYSGMMARESALKELEKDPYPLNTLEEEKKFVLKKLGLTDAQFETLMAMPRKTFRDYKNSYGVERLLRLVLFYLRKGRFLYS